MPRTSPYRADERLDDWIARPGRAHPPPPPRGGVAGSAVGGRPRRPPRPTRAGSSTSCAGGSPASPRPDLRRAVPHDPFTLLDAGRHVVGLRAVRADLDARARLPAARGPDDFRDWDERGTVRVLFAHWAEPLPGRRLRARVRGARRPGRRHRPRAAQGAVDGDRPVRAAGGRRAADGRGAAGGDGGWVGSGRPFGEPYSEPRQFAELPLHPHAPTPPATDEPDHQHPARHAARAPHTAARQVLLRARLDRGAPPPPAPAGRPARPPASPSSSTVQRGERARRASPSAPTAVRSARERRRQPEHAVLDAHDHRRRRAAPSTRPPAKATHASAPPKPCACPHHQCSVKRGPQFFSA